MARKKAKNRKRFLAVDIWQREFADVSVRAVYDVFAQKLNIPTEEMKNYSFSQCVHALRKLENPDYVEPKDQARV